MYILYYRRTYHTKITIFAQIKSFSFLPLKNLFYQEQFVLFLGQEQIYVRDGSKTKMSTYKITFIHLAI
jgi:hypothetical protein